MKKIILLLSIIFVLAGLFGCKDDNDGGSSSPTGVDFGDDDALEDFGSYIAINGSNSLFRIMILSKKDVTSCELTINGNEIDVNDNWIDFSDFDDDFGFGVVLDDSLLPQSLVFEPGTELDVNFKLNGSSHNYTVTMPSLPGLEEQDFDINKDFTMNWTLDKNPNAQLVYFSGEGSYWVEDDDGIWFDKDVSPSARSYTFSKSLYSDYVVSGLSWYEYGAQTINYKLSKTNILAVYNDSFIEVDNLDKKDTKEQVFKTINLFNSIVK